MESITDSFSYIFNKLNYFSKGDSNSIEDNKIIEYNHFIIKNNKINKNKVDNFYCKINITFDIISETDNCALSLNETLSTLNFLVSKKEILESCDSNNISFDKNMKKTIETLYFNIIKIYFNECNNETNIFKRISTNSKLFEFIIDYIILLFHPAFKDSMEYFYRSNLSRSLRMAIKDGCVISWLTFVKLHPDMGNESCYPMINKSSPIYQKINWEYIKSKKQFEPELDKFFKYHKDKSN
jgi:hypothetical protein